LQSKKRERQKIIKHSRGKCPTIKREKGKQDRNEEETNNQEKPPPTKGYLDHPRLAGLHHERLSANINTSWLRIAEEK